MSSSSEGIRLTSLSTALQTRILAELSSNSRAGSRVRSSRVKTLAAEDKDSWKNDEKVARMKKMITDLESKVSDIKEARAASKKITSEIKHCTVADDISSRVEALAKKVGVDSDELSDAQRAILDANDVLQSAIFALDEPFELLQNALEDSITDLEWEIDERLDTLKKK